MMAVANNLSIFLEKIPKNRLILKEGCFNTEEFIQNLFFGNYSENDIDILKKICKKVDVTNIVVKFYDDELRAKAVEESIANSGYDRLVCHLIMAFIQASNYKFINTVLKILDGILYCKGAYQVSKELKMLCESFLDDVL